MKRLWLLMVMLLLGACGGGTTPGGSNEIKAGIGNTGKVVVKIAQNTSKVVALAPAATKLRLVISNPTLQINNTPFKYIVDGDIPDGNQITGLTFPVASGYTFEVITYKPLPVGATTTEVNRMLNHSKATGVNVTTDGVTVDLVLQPIQAEVVLPETVLSGATFSVSAKFPSQPTPLQNTWNLFLKTNEIDMGTALHSTAAPKMYSSMKAPYVLTAGTLYAQGEFYINTSLLDTTGNVTMVDSRDTALIITHKAEEYHNWTFNWPNPDFGDSVTLAQSLLTLQGVTVTIQM